MKQFIAVQTGARRNYAVPSILAHAGLLDTFYTDLCADVGVGKAIADFCPQSLRRGSLQNLINRRLPANLKPKTQTFANEVLVYLLRQRLARHRPEQSVQSFVQFQKDFGRAMMQRGLGQATHLFTMFGEGMPLIRFAKERGLTTVTEIFILWSAHTITERERELFPDLEAPLAQCFSQRSADSGRQWVQELLSLTDWAIAPSEAVRQDQATNYGFPTERCFVVPYAVDNSWFEIENQPIRGRILFVGTADLRKGIHYLGMAANRLQSRGYEFRVAGNVSDQIRDHPLMRSLQFLGRVPRGQIKQEYAAADIFVLPSLAEGSAEVTYEALATGLPIVTTAASGSVVRDGIEGFIIPERDPEMLAQRIEELVEQRELRDRMALAARARAREYTWTQYAERLLTVFQAV